MTSKWLIIKGLINSPKISTFRKAKEKIRKVKLKKCK
jgi:hypothetical protein